MPHRLTLTEMAAKIQARQMSPVELLESHVRQIERWNPRLNAFAITVFDEARAQARRLEQQLHSSNSTLGQPLGSLAGVPVSVKECFDLAGLPTTLCSRLLPAAPADRDSALVERLRRAGAVILGKTNTPEFMVSYETDNEIYGRTNNPWDFERTPGGSSGGEAAAIAAFCSAGGIGSDGGGSIRVPAHFCGIAGLKPTPGRLSTIGERTRGATPHGIGVPGPMARTVRDVRALFKVLAGYDERDSLSAPVGAQNQTIDGIRIGVMEQFGSIPVDPAISEALRKDAAKLSVCGFAIDEFRPEGLDRAPNLWSFFFNQVPAVPFRKFIAGRESEVSWTALEGLDKLAAMPAPTAAELLEAQAERDAIRRHLLDQMRSTPVLLMPPASIPAMKHRERRWEIGGKSIGMFQAMMTCTPWNLLGFPALVLPFGKTERGLPVGVQLVGRPFSEELLLEIGVRLEEARGPFAAPEPYLS